MTTKSSRKPVDSSFYNGVWVSDSSKLSLLVISDESDKKNIVYNVYSKNGLEPKRYLEEELSQALSDLKAEKIRYFEIVYYITNAGEVILLEYPEFYNSFESCTEVTSRMCPSLRSGVYLDNFEIYGFNRKAGRCNIRLLDNSEILLYSINGDALANSTLRERQADARCYRCPSPISFMENWSVNEMVDPEYQFKEDLRIDIRSKVPISRLEVITRLSQEE